jgi:hypothetical protein
VVVVAVVLVYLLECCAGVGVFFQHPSDHECLPFDYVDERVQVAAEVGGGEAKVNGFGPVGWGDRVGNGSAELLDELCRSWCSFDAIECLGKDLRADECSFGLVVRREPSDFVDNVNGSFDSLVYGSAVEDLASVEVGSEVAVMEGDRYFGVCGGPDVLPKPLSSGAVCGEGG